VTEPLILHQRIKLPYRYTAGPVHEAVLNGFVDRTVLGGECDGCGYVAAPARPFCPSCSDGVSNLVAVAEEGTLLSWTEGAGDAPERFALVRLDGASGAMFHRLLSDDPPAPGMRVRIEWASDPTPEITAIEGFVPL
jgi:uncharacterized OB-fold protein